MRTRIYVTALLGFAWLGNTASDANEATHLQRDRSHNVQNKIPQGVSVGSGIQLEDVGDRIVLARQVPVSRLEDSQFTFRVEDLDGNVVTSSDDRFKNKVVLFDIWGTWCPPCREMTPFLKKLHDDYASKGLVVVGIAFEIDEGDGGHPEKRVSDYVSKNGIEHLILYGGAAEHPSTLVFQKMSFREFDGFPTVVIVDRDGKPKRIEEGYDDQIAERLEAFIRNLLDSK